MNPYINIGIKAARRAGQIALDNFTRLDRISVSQKGHNDFVSEVDQRIEEDIIDTIQYQFPHHSVLAEESGLKQPEISEKPINDDDDYTWIIDPLDGTANFLHGNPHFCISIAAQKQQRIEHAIIYDPIRNDLFTATRGQGAQLNNQRIRTSKQKNLRLALLGTNFPARYQQLHQSWMADFVQFSRAIHDVRISGSAALDLAYVACGRIDGFWQPGLDIWDVAAGSLLVRESGGLVADFDGQQDHFDKKEIVASNLHLVNHLLTGIKKNRDTSNKAS